MTAQGPIQHQQESQDKANEPLGSLPLLETPPPPGAVGGPVDLDETVVTTASMMDMSLIASHHKGAGTAVTPLPMLGLDVDSQKQEEDSLLFDKKPEKESWVNHGFVLWEKSRKEWLQRPPNDATVALSMTQQTQGEVEAPPPPQPRAVPLDVDEIIDIIFLSTSTSAKQQQKNGPVRFPQNVALPQMVDILQDLWEAEGLDA
uniref:Gag1-like clamp domain-containing protein n=1 Tax=Entomoneis paludosa TaxID=265537 RepID=A0A6U3C476_9STRA|mmetsp:Transcript_34271/g.71340  ORF Transcript_34271/g.71340 Transcript_34271/m.71340 type:complete len:203 (+) Transcript_34271:588-1196(+)